MMEGVKTLPSPAPVNISSKQQLVQTKSIEQCSENLRNSLNNNNSPSSGIGKSDVSSSVTNSSDLKYLHKKFKRIASATVDDLPTPRSQRDSDRSGVGLSERCPPSINGDDRISSPKITNSTDIHVQRQEILPNKIPIVQIHQPQVHQNSVSFQPSVPGGAACTDQNPPSSGRNVCQYCNLNCTKPSVLQKHIRSHTNERPYPCTPCGFAFKTKSNLYKHCRSRAHTLRLQGVDAPPQDDDLSDQDQDNDLSSNASGSDVVSRTASPMDDRVVSPYQMPEKPYKPKFHNAAAFYTKEESTESSVSGSGSIYQQDNCGPPIASNSTRNFPIAVPSNHQAHQLASQQDLEQHISKIISDNEAIMEDVEPALQKKYHKITGISRGTSIQDGSTSKASTSAGPVKIHRDESHPVSLLAKINSQAMVQPNVVNQQTPSPLLPLQSTSAQPLNLIKIPTPATESSDSLRKRCYSESFGGADLTTVANHPQNPERSIIKGLLLDWKSVTGGDGDDAVHTCQLCKISFRSAENLKYHSICYCQGNHSAPLSPVGTPSHKYSRSNSIHVNLPEKYNPNSLKNLAKYTLRQPPPRNPSTLSKLAQSQLRHPKPKPEKIVLSQSNLIASSSSTSRQPAMCEIQTPLPSPGPLLGKTRLVEDKRSQSGSDEVVITHVNHDLKHMKRGPDPQSNFPDQDAEVKLTAEKRLRLEYANSSQIPLSGIYGNTKAPALSLVGLEYLRNNKHMPQTEGHSGKNREMYGGEISHAKKFDVKMQSEDSIRRDSSGGSIISESPGSDSEQNISIRTPGLYSGGKVEKMATTRDSPPIHPLTPSLLVASTLCAPSLVSSGKSGMNHFQFPPINPITAFNPLTLPPVSVTPEHATTILHGGKLIPFVPGIPGPNTSTPTKVNIKRTSSPNMKKSLSGNPLIFSMSNNAGKKIDHPPLFNGQHQPMSIPSIKIESLEEKNRLREQKFKPMPKMKQPEMKKSFIFARIADNLSPRKPDVADEETHFSFENIPKAEVKVPTQQPVSVEIPSETEKRDEMTEKQRTKFLRPTSLPLKPGTFIPKRHHGITPTTNTLPLISPETPRPSKTCIQMYINGQAYTYLGLKCSTKPFYCTVNKTQPIYLPHHIRTISMYSQWQVCAESNPHPLGLKPDAVISLYDSRHRPMNYTVAQTSKEFREIKSIQSQGTICTPFVITHKDQNQHHALKQLPIPVEKIVDKSPEKDVSGSKNDGVVNSTVPGGYESTEDYEYVKGRGFGRYVCHTCGIRCRKPSMLKKHIRTHTNIRPYTCQYCAFSFKTKGNLTKHMKSKSHAKKCEELGIIPIPMTVSDEVLEMDSNKERQVTVPGDSDSDDDSDGDEPDSELSDADESRSRLQEHEAAKCLLSLSMTNHASESSTDAPSSFCKSPQYPAQASDVQSATQRRVITFNSPPTIFDFPRLEQYYSNPNIHKVLVSTPGASSHFEYDDAGNMPMDLTKPRELTPTKVADVVTTMEPASFLISLVSITDKMPQTPIPAEIDGNKLLQEYLTEKALQGSKMKQCQKNAEVLSNGNVIFISSPVGTPVKDVKNELSGEKTTASIETLAEIAASSKKMDVLGKGFPTRTSNDVAKNVASEYLKMTSKSKVLFPQKADDGAESGTEVADPPTDGNISVNSSKIAGILARTVVVGENGRVTPEYPAGSFSPARRLTRIQEDGRSVCEICSKTFQKPSQLHLHFNIHFLERKYRCEPCAVSFRTQGHLRKHERSDGHNNKVSRTSTFGVPTTTNPRPFKCSDCKVAFRIHGHLAKHLRSKMHVLRLECHGKLPFGTYAEIERAGMSLTDIDTTDCENSLASLKSLAQKLHESDPSKLSQWNTPNNRSSAGSGAEAGDSDTDEGDEGSPDDSLSGNENSTLLGNTIEGVVTEGGGGMKRKVEDLAMPSALGSATETLPTLPEKRLKSASFDT
ncbi:pneumococcal serine-rich repeat protein [Sergentomyia squamirostris]